MWNLILQTAGEHQYIYPGQKDEYFSVISSDVLWKLPSTLPAGMFKCQISQLCFVVDFSDLMPL